MLYKQKDKGEELYEPATRKDEGPGEDSFLGQRHPRLHL